jgi:hypothetical protein
MTETGTVEGHGQALILKAKVSVFQREAGCGRGGTRTTETSRNKQNATPVKYYA